MSNEPLETMDDAKRAFLNMLEGPLGHAKEWKCTSAQFGSAELPISSPEGARPFCGVFEAGDGIRRVVIAAWFPPEDGPAVHLKMEGGAE